MRLVLAAVLLLTASVEAMAQSTEKDYRGLVELGSDENGQIATSVNAAEVKHRPGYSPGAETHLVFWVEARKPDSGPTTVIAAGERVRYVLPAEAPRRGELGPWDTPDPAYAGSPWRKTDLRYSGIRVECLNDQHWCLQIWATEIVLPEDVVRSAVNNPKQRTIPLSLSKRRKVEWRISREELIATLDALGVLEEYAGAPATR